MSADPDRLAERIAAIERTLTDGHELDDLPDGAALGARQETLVDRVDALETRLDDLEATLQALRGYVGEVRAVNRTVERRAAAALAAVEDPPSLEDVPEVTDETDPGVPRERPPVEPTGGARERTGETTTRSGPVSDGDRGPDDAPGRSPAARDGDASQTGRDPIDRAEAMLDRVRDSL